MAASGYALAAGDIVRGGVEKIDTALDACFLDAGPYGMVYVPLGGLPERTRCLVQPRARVCVQISSPQRGQKLPRGSVHIEFCTRTSVLVIDGAALTARHTPAELSCFVSRSVPAPQRSTLVQRLERAVKDSSTGIPSVLEAATGPVRIILRSLAASLPWSEVLPSVVVQLTELAAFTVLARSGSGPALLLGAKDSAHPAYAGTAGYYRMSADMLNGCRLAVKNGATAVFEQTEAMWTVDVNSAHVHAADKEELLREVNSAAAQAIAETLVEYNVSGLIAVDFISGASAELFESLQQIMRRVLGSRGVHISGDRKLSVMLIARQAASAA